MKKFPDWRFDFSEEWKYTELRNYIKSSSLKNVGSLYEAYSVNNKLGLVRQDEQFEDMWYERLDKSSCKVVRPNEFAYNPARINVGSIAYNHFDYPVALSPMYIVFSTEENLDDEFLWQYFKTEKFAYELYFNLEGSVRFCLPYGKLCRVQFPNIELDEQKKIGDYLATFDNAVAAQEKKLLNWRELKKGLLQKIFSREWKFTDEHGNFYPDWIEKTLEEVCDIFDGTHQTPHYVDSGIKFVSVENIKNLYATKKFISEEDFEKKYKHYPQKGDVLMTRIGDIGTPALVPTDEKLAFYVSLTLFKPKNILSEYLLQVIQSEFVQLELKYRSLQNAFPKKINKSDIGKCKILFPCFEEQKKIGDYFTELDKIISAENKILGNMKLMKKGLLQKLFVRLD